MGKDSVAWLLLGAAFIGLSAPASAKFVGRVIGLHDGQPVPQAMVTLSMPSGTAGPAAITVFTDDEGRFTFEDAKAAPATGAGLAADKLGFRQVKGASGAQAGGETTLFLEPTANIASQAPASAWFARAPAGTGRNVTIASCSSCHQTGSPKMRDYAAKIDAVRGGPDGDRRALEEWRKVVRHEAWRTIVKYMRTQHYSVLPIESAMNLNAIDWPTAIDANLNFFTENQGETIAQYLAGNFHGAMDQLSVDDYSLGAPLGVTARTTIREYPFPDDALVRELVPSPAGPFLWGADVRRNLLAKLDPRTGVTKWYPVDFKGSTGPHTIVPDDTGHLWISMVDNDQFGRFDPKTESWKLWTLRPGNLPTDPSLAGAAIVHDMSIDSRGHLARDQAGRIWVTLVGTNQMGSLHPDSGEVSFYDTNTISGLSPINHLIYSTVLSEDGRYAWYSQVNGHVGCFDTQTNTVTKLVEFTEGTGPRRMMRDNAGRLWVALFGTGQVASIDMRAGRVLRTYDLPDRASAPYAVTWDERRKTVWVATANSDSIYRLDPDSGDVTVYPLPRKMAFLRQIAVHPHTGQLVATYGNYPAGSGPSMGLLIDVGD